jgi:hypothetical protein
MAAGDRTRRSSEPPARHGNIGSGETYAEVAHEALFRRWDKLREWIWQFDAVDPTRAELKSTWVCKRPIICRPPWGCGPPASSRGRRREKAIYSLLRVRHQPERVGAQVNDILADPPHKGAPARPDFNRREPIPMLHQRPA